MYYKQFFGVGQPTVGMPTTLIWSIKYNMPVGVPIIITRGIFMRLVDAVYKRITDLAKQRSLSMNALANLCGVPRPTIVTMTRSTTVKLSTIYDICDGLNITLKDFFDSPLFATENLTD